MVSLINKQLLLTAYAYLFIMEQQKAQQGVHGMNLMIRNNREQQQNKVRLAIKGDKDLKALEAKLKQDYPNLGDFIAAEIKLEAQKQGIPLCPIEGVSVVAPPKHCLERQGKSGKSCPTSYVPVWNKLDLKGGKYVGTDIVKAYHLTWGGSKIFQGMLYQKAENSRELRACAFGDAEQGWYLVCEQTVSSKQVAKKGAPTRRSAQLEPAEQVPKAQNKKNDVRWEDCGRAILDGCDVVGNGIAAFLS